MQYNTDQWLIFKYPIGAGGKFLASCFFQFDKIAHWAQSPLTSTQTIDWYTKSLPASIHDPWPQKEIDTPWVLPFSRAWPRGENLTEQEFNSYLDLSQNDYLKKSWADGKVIADFWHKDITPNWWTCANWITIAVDDMVLYKKLIFSKPFEYNAQEKTIVFQDQRPDLGRQQNKAQKTQFKNQWLWENISDPEQFYQEYIIHLPWYQTWNFTQVPTTNYITLTELFDVDKLITFMLQYQDMFNQHIDQNFIRAMHNTWHYTTVERFRLCL